MRHKRIFWQIFPANLLILFLTAAMLVGLCIVSLQSSASREAREGLEARAVFARSAVVHLLSHKTTAELREFCTSSGREANIRLTVISTDGAVLADSAAEPDSFPSQQTQPEFLAAMQGQTGVAHRLSPLSDTPVTFLAVPLYAEGSERVREAETPQLLGVLRMSLPRQSVWNVFLRIAPQMVIGGVLLLLIVFFLSRIVAQNISRPIETIRNFTERFSNGDFSRRLPFFAGHSVSSEVADLAAVLDKMAGQLNERIETIRSQRNELETVFAGMVESVIAVDKEERIFNINRAAAKLLGLDREAARGRIVQEVLRNLNLQKQIQQVFSTGASVEDEIVHPGEDGEKYLQTNIVSLNDPHGNVLGVLVVLNDVTKMRRLETVRRDFVANVSHELRTPITSIRGYVETLIDGAIEDRDDAMRFLDIILRQAERLNEIIEDLLALSRIEQEADRGLIRFEDGLLYRVLAVAAETCQLKAEEAGVPVRIECDETLRVQMNATLIEQALVNLLVNAIRYSTRGEFVRVVAYEGLRDGERFVQINVIDTGVGIAVNHLPRLFERFYRSDKARSRKQGGTGLGLAIVKHIALAHGGRVGVKSEVGKGSTFSVILPG